jgi:hypothetical protein
MTPRLRFGTVPFAAFAQNCASVPAGAVMFFTSSECPDGWSPFASLDGRVPVGAGTGTPGATVGTSLSNQGTRTITEVPSHTHVVDPPAEDTSEAGNHSHTGSTTFSGGHFHNVGIPLRNAGPLSSNVVQGAGETGGAELSNITLRTDSAGGHSHDVNVWGAPDHFHSVDVSPFLSAASGAPSVDVTMPYVQLRACVKD